MQSNRREGRTGFVIHPSTFWIELLGLSLEAIIITFVSPMAESFLMARTRLDPLMPGIASSRSTSAYLAPRSHARPRSSSGAAPPEAAKVATPQHCREARNDLRLTSP